jgi:hypothetical protein
MTLVLHLNDDHPMDEALINFPEKFSGKEGCGEADFI